MTNQRLVVLSASATVALVIGIASFSDSFGQGPGRAAQAQQQQGPPAEPYGSMQRGAYRPEYDAQGQLIRPAGWREWPYIGTPLTPNGLNSPEASFPEFHNVYIDPESWDHFKRTGDFRDGTVLVKELVLTQRNASPDPANGSTAESSGRGYFMAEYSGLEAAIKDGRRFADQPGKWAYFSFGHVPESQYKAATAPEPVDTCNACHAVNAGRDFVFIQHYPVLRGAESRVKR